MITITVELNKKEDKKIQLLECLQTGSGNWAVWCKDRPQNLHKCKSFELNDAYKIRGMDLILVTTQNDVTQIWLGHWNDGMV